MSWKENPPHGVKLPFPGFAIGGTSEGVPLPTTPTEQPLTPAEITQPFPVAVVPHSDTLPAQCSREGELYLVDGVLYVCDGSKLQPQAARDNCDAELTAECMIGGGCNSTAKLTAGVETISGAGFPDMHQRLGPWESPNVAADIFLIMRDTTSNRPTALRSSDDANTWAIVDAANQPALLCRSSMCTYVSPDSPHLIHIATGDATNPSTLSYHIFDMLAGAWALKDETITVNGIADASDNIAPLCVLSTGEVIVLYTSKTTISSRYAIRSALGVWTDETIIQDAPNDYAANCVVRALPGDRVHFFSHNVSLDQVEHRSRAADGTLDTAQVVDAGAAVIAHSSWTGESYVDDDGVTQIVVPYIITTGTIGYVARAASAANPTFTTTAFSDVAVSLGPSGFASRNPMICSAINGKDVWLAFVQGPNDDLYAEYSRDGGGFRTDVSLHQGTVKDISANFVGTPKRLVYIIRDSSTTKLNEKLNVSRQTKLCSDGITVDDDGIHSPAPDANKLVLYPKDGEWFSRGNTGNPIAMRDRAAYKAANESVASSTTLQNDDNLKFSVAANDIWTFELFLIVSGDAAGDIKIAFTAPTGATINWGAIGQTIADAFSDAVVSGSGTTASFGVGAASRTILIRGTVVVSTTAGTIQLQWAQDTSSVTATVVATGSHITAHQIS